MLRVITKLITIDALTPIAILDKKIQGYLYAIETIAFIRKINIVDIDIKTLPVYINTCIMITAKLEDQPTTTTIIQEGATISNLQNDIDTYYTNCVEIKEEMARD